MASDGSLSLAAVAATSTFGQSVTVETGGSLTVGAGASATFGQNVTVQSGATLTFSTGANVLIDNGVTITDNGTLNVNSPAALVGQDTSNSVAGGIVVNGAMAASNTAFTRGGGGGVFSLQVAAGGHLTASNCTFAWDGLTLSASSSDAIQFSIFATQLAINSGATISINSDDFSSTSATVVASGDPNATINLVNNYWGTTNTAQIDAKITDRNDAPVNTRPLVLYNPFQSTAPQPPGSITGLAFNDLNGNGARDTGEPGQAGVVVYLDTNDNGTLDPGEPSVVTRSGDPLRAGRTRATRRSVSPRHAVEPRPTATVALRARPPAGRMSQIRATFPSFHESTPMSEQEKHAHLPETPLPHDNPKTDGPTEATTWEAYSPEILEAVLDP